MLKIIHKQPRDLKPGSCGRWVASQISSLSRDFVIVALGLLFCPSPALAESDPSTVHFRSPRDFSVVVPVYVNESGPYEFLFDTGSSTTAVDMELQRSLELTPLGPATITTVIGRSSGFLAEARTIRVGSVLKSNVEVVVRHLGGLHNLDPKIRGVLGQNIWRDVDYLLDNRRRTIQFDASGQLLESISGERIPALKIPAYPDSLNTVVRVTLPGGPSREFNLVLDSGSATLVLFSDLWLPFRVPQTSRSFLEDDAGHRQFVAQSSVELQVGSTYRRIQAQLSAFNLKTAGINGLLPTSVFPSIYICNRGGFIILQPKQSPRRNSDKSLAELGQEIPLAPNPFRRIWVLR